MTSKKVTIKLESGLEARPVAMLVQVASQYDSDIYVESASKTVSYTHLDVYKRQSIYCAVAGNIS